MSFFLPSGLFWLCRGLPAVSRSNLGLFFIVNIHSREGSLLQHPVFSSRGEGACYSSFVVHSTLCL